MDDVLAILDEFSDTDGQLPGLTPEQTNAGEEKHVHAFREYLEEELE